MQQLIRRKMRQICKIRFDITVGSGLLLLLIGSSVNYYMAVVFYAPPESYNTPPESYIAMTISNETETDETDETDMNLSDDFISGCLLTMDDNHKLVEWLAYHHHVLPLQHLVVAVDPNSITSPTELFNRWRKRGMIIEQWTDEDFIPPSMAKKNRKISITPHDIHKLRQRQFIVQCLRHLKNQNRSWAIHIDTDEYLQFNGPVGKHNSNVTTVSHRSVQEQGAVLNFLSELETRNESQPCFQVPRSNFGNSETVNDTEAIPHILKDVSLSTMRYRKHGEIGKLPPKSLVNLSKITMKDIGKTIHRVHAHKTVDLCKESKSEKNKLLVINHYIGTRESFHSRRNDGRDEKVLANIYKLKVEDAEDGLSDDSIRPWVDGFVYRHGENESLALLKGAGELSDIE